MKVLAEKERERDARLKRKTESVLLMKVSSGKKTKKRESKSIEDDEDDNTLNEHRLT